MKRTFSIHVIALIAILVGGIIWKKNRAQWLAGTVAVKTELVVNQPREPELASSEFQGGAAHPDAPLEQSELVAEPTPIPEIQRIKLEDARSLSQNLETQALASEANAHLMFEQMTKCIAGVSGAPIAQNEKDVLQARCLRVAHRIAEKFTSFRRAFQENVLTQVSEGARRHERQMAREK